MIMVIYRSNLCSVISESLYSAGRPGETIELINAEIPGKSLAGDKPEIES